MSKTKPTNVAPVLLSDLERIVKQIRKNTKDIDPEISFEFIIASLFPSSWNNIQKALIDQYIQGYNDAEKERRQLKQMASAADSDCYCE